MMQPPGHPAIIAQAAAALMEMFPWLLAEGGQWKGVE